MPSQPPSRGHTLHATREVVGGLSHTHRGHASVQLGRGGELDKKDVVVDGEAVVIGVLENLIQERHLLVTHNGECTTIHLNKRD